MTAKSKFLPTELVDYIELDNGKKLHLNEHSRKRIITRKIPENYIIETFVNSDCTYPNKDYKNARNYVKQFNGKRLKIGVKDDEEPYVLITAFMQ